MVRFIQLSDLHIRGSMHRDENENCGKLVAWICEHYAADENKPVVLLTGDITDDGKEDQYRNAVALLRPLVDAGFRVLACPGNHDYGPWGNFYTEEGQRRFQRHIMTELLAYPAADAQGVEMEGLFPTTHVEGDVVFIGLDSVVGREDALAHFASGEVGENQRGRLAEILRAHAERRKVVYFHHHPFNRHLVMEMADAHEVMRLLAGRADVVCFGHNHESDIWSSAHDIDWILAAGKSNRRNARYKFEFREVTFDGENSHVTKLMFKRD
ncbi:MAG: metallophosphoesterase [Nannocystaceae bacterium]